MVRDVPEPDVNPAEAASAIDLKWSQWRTSVIGMKRARFNRSGVGDELSSFSGQARTEDTQTSNVLGPRAKM